ncbi:SGNH/GDSL hydrolase family protein [Undibacterium sp.]|uniref:SGNH/GDSL hydrolase family protein n=1 Tax=Undibacterium sp. TaxID=1914977 RepID=UPI00374CCE01
MRQYLPELLALPLYPLLSLQGKHVRRITPRLPEAGGPDHGVAHWTPPDGSPAPSQPPQALRLVAIGESPVAGVGVELHTQAITAQLAAMLAQQAEKPVHWQAVGLNGADLARALRELVPRLPSPEPAVDIALIAFGVNDTTSFHSSARYRTELAQLVAAVQARLAPTLIILSGVPPMHEFPSLPQPLRFVLGQKARALDKITETLARELSGVHYISMLFNTGESGLMAVDGYHPSEKGVLRWAQHMAAAMRLSIGQLGPKK